MASGASPKKTRSGGSLASTILSSAPRAAFGREIDALTAEGGMMLLFERENAVIAQTRGTAPHDDVAVIEPGPLRSLGPGFTAEQKHGRSSEGDRHKLPIDNHVVRLLSRSHTGMGRHSMISTESPGKIVKCG
jgi:hypothetical protein